jgi:hypothetical protein
MDTVAQQQKPGSFPANGLLADVQIQDFPGGHQQAVRQVREGVPGKPQYLSTADRLSFLRQ